MLMIAMPPTTPPAMAPLLGCLLDASVADVEAVGRGAEAEGSTLAQEM